MMQVPIRVRFSTKCNRCGKRYPKEERECVHCSDLSDREVEELKLRFQEEHITNTNLGKLFIYISMLLLIFICLITIY